MDVFMEKMKKKQGRKALIIEEAWKAIASPQMAGFILYLFKTIRKFYGEAMVVTQDLEDILGNAIVKNSIISNSDTICLLDQGKFRNNFSATANLLGIDESEQCKLFTVNRLTDRIKRGPYREVYIKRGATGEVYGIEASPEEYMLYTTEFREKKILEKYRKEKGNIEDAIEAFMSEFRKSGLEFREFLNSIRL